MKSREQKQKDLQALTEELNAAKSAMVITFGGLTVGKDQEFRSQLRDLGAKYQVVKNTIARLAVKDSPYSEMGEHFQGMSAIAWTESDPVDLSKTISKFVKENKNNYTFKVGIVEGKVVDFSQVEAIADLPSKEELIGKLLYLLNAPAQRLATVLSAIPRDLAVVLGQIAEGKGDLKASEGEAKEEVKTETAAAEEAAVEEAKTEETVETAPEEAKAETSEETAETEAAPTSKENTEEAKAADSEEKSEE